MNLTAQIGDSESFNVILKWKKRLFTPGSKWDLIFTVKSDPNSQDDSERLFQKYSDFGITVEGSIATIEMLRADTFREEDFPEEGDPAFEATPGIYYWDIQATCVEAGDDFGKVRTVANGTLELERDITRGASPSGPIYLEEEPVFRGASAYEVAVDNGFVGTEEEWLESLYGENADIAATINSSPSKSAPSDDDRFILTDSGFSFAPRKLTWANIKASVKSYFDTLYAAISHSHSVGDITSVGNSKLLGRHDAGAGAAQEIGIDGGLELHGGNLRRAAVTGPVTITAGGSTSAIADGALSIAMTSGLQSALNGKQATLTDYSTISSLTGYPSSFTPSSHTHPWSQITGEANHVPFNIAPTSVPTTEGTVSWNSDDHTLNITTDVSGVVLQVGQEQHVRVRNTTGSTISNGAAVYLSGASGQRPTVALADADNDTHVASTIGLATADISHNAFGFVTVGGLVRGVNTTGMTEGGPIYLSGTAGGLTQTSPTSNVVRIGFCVVAGNNGTILVHVEKMSFKSADVLDAASAWSGSGDTGKVVKYGANGILSPGLVDCATTGAVSITGLSFGNTGVFGSSDSSYGVQGQSSTGTGVQCFTATGTYHALFGADSGNNRSAIERVRGWFVWFYSSYVGRIKTADLTANRDWTLPDTSGTIALLSGAQTFTDQITLSGQAATGATSAMTRGLGDARYSQTGGYNTLTANADSPNNTTLTNRLTVSGLAAGTYIVRFGCRFSGAAPKMMLAFTGTFDRESAVAFTGNSGSNPVIRTAIINTQFDSVYGYGGTVCFRVTGTGDLSLQHAQVTSSASTCSMLTGAFIEIQKV